jgi:hypothetical protein
MEAELTQRSWFIQPLSLYFNGLKTAQMMRPFFKKGINMKKTADLLMLTGPAAGALHHRADADHVGHLSDAATAQV